MSLYNGSGNDVPLKPQALTAFADNAIGNLFNACSVSGGEQTLSKLDQGVAQISALKSRLMSTSAWVKSMGKTALHEASFQKRLLAISRYPGSVGNDNTERGQASMTGLGAYEDREVFRPYAGAHPVPPAVTGITPANFAAATIATAVDNATTVTGSAACDFRQGMPLGSNPTGGAVLPGDILVIAGVSYNVVAVTDATNLACS